MKSISSNNAIAFHHLKFRLNSNSGYFQHIQGDMSIGIPDELRIETTQKRTQIYSSKIIRGRLLNGRYLFFTGLLQTRFNGWYFGDHPAMENGKRISSFILFRFNNQETELDVFFYHKQKVSKSNRQNFIQNQIQKILSAKVHFENAGNSELI